MNITIITGLGKAGTTWLAEHLAKYNTENWYAGHETLIYTFTQARWPRIVDGTIDREKFWEDYKKAMAEFTNAENVVSVDCNMRFFVPASPDIKVALLARNPFDNLKSYFNMGVEPITATQLLKVVPPNNDFKPEYGGFTVDNWNSLNVFQKMAWSWTVINEYVMKHASSIFTFEKLVSNYDEMTRMFNFVGLNPEGKFQDWDISRTIRINKVQEQRKTGKLFAWENMPECCKLDLFRICGGTMKKVGYING